MSKVIDAVRAQLKTIAVLAVICVVIYGIVLYNHAADARTTALLSNPDQTGLDNTVLDMANHGSLLDALSATQNPNEDKSSPQNTKSAAIWKNVADSVDRLVAGNRLSPDIAFDLLMKLCKDDDSKGEVKAGLTSLGNSSHQNLQTLVKYLSDGDPDYRGAAVDALTNIGGLGIAQIVDPLIKDSVATSSVTKILSAIGKPALPVLEAHLTDPDSDFRQSVLKSIGDLGDPSSVPVLVGVAEHDIPPVQRVAIDAIAKIDLKQLDLAKKAAAPPTPAPTAATAPAGATAPVAATASATPAPAAPPAGPSPAEMTDLLSAEPVLISYLEYTPNDTTARQQAALTLGEIGSQNAVKALILTLSDYNKDIADAAVDGLESTGAQAVPLLLPLLTHGDEQTRAEAAKALGNSGTPEAIAALKAAFDDPTTPTSVRLNAVIGFGNSNNPAVLKPLIDALGDREGSVATAASEGLLAPNLRNQVIPLLIASFTKPTPMPFNASQTLALMEGDAVPALKTCLVSPDPAVKTWASITLGQSSWRDPDIDAKLQQLTNDPNPQVSYAASQALQQRAGS